MWPEYSGENKNRALTKKKFIVPLLSSFMG